MSKTRQIVSNAQLENVRSALTEVEQKRQLLWRWERRGLLLLAVPVLIFVVLVGIESVRNLGLMGLFIPVLCLFVIVAMGGDSLFKPSRKAERKLQQWMGEAVLQQLQPEWQFFAADCQPLDPFYDLNILGHHHFIRGANLIKGEIEGTTFSCNHLTVLPPNRDETYIHFQGMLITLELDRALQGRTIVIPDRAQQQLGTYLGKKVQEKGHGSLELVYLEDPVFEKLYAVFGEDQIEARYVLTPLRMQRLVELRSRFGENISFSFNQKQVAIVIHHYPFTTVHVESPIHQDAAIQHLLEPIRLVEELVQALQLS
ncbi:MAG: DUF3137 domain-containing protein [Saprospiraceae bacterium]|nr:DUF3137 domain-containing protein [Saprospiraceae bacterium]